jgi:tetratricopeptide (TPR) repeat protein
MSEENGMIRAYDERGREVLIDRETWRRDILPDNLRKAWNDPDGLYQLIIGALNDGFHADVLAASERLNAIDNLQERGTCIYAITLMALERHEEAEGVLRAYIARHGETGVILTNLAKTFSYRGEEQECHRLLRRGLSFDPNQDNALYWWMGIKSEEGGETAVRSALEEIDREAGSWRAKLELARLRLQGHDYDGALALHRAALAITQSPEAFHQVSGDLGQAGLIKEMVELVAPLYELDRHGPACGVNLLRAYAALGESIKGRLLWRRIKELGYADLDPVLAELEQMLVKPETLAATPEKPLEMGMPTLEGPVWLRGLGDAAWLMEGFGGGIKICILPLILPPPEGKEEMHGQIEDDVGRLSRSLPLFLAEMLSFSTDARVVTGLPTIVGQGPIVTSEAWPNEILFPDFAKGGEPWLLLTGRMPCKGFVSRVEIDIWNGASGEKLTTIKQGARDGTDKHALDLAEKVLVFILQSGMVKSLAPPSWFAPPKPERQVEWLVALGQMLAQQFALNKMFPADRLWNEHGIFEWHFNLAEGSPGWIPPAILAICSTLAGIGYGSPVVGRYYKALEKLLARHEGKGDPVDLLSPLAYHRLGNQAACAKSKERLASISNPLYREWLGKI